MPEPEAISPTDAEVVASLGWDPLPGDTPPEPEPVQVAEVKPEVKEAAPVSAPVPESAAPPVPDQVTKALSELRLNQVKTQIDAAEERYVQQLISQGMEKATAQTQARGEAASYWQNYQLDQQNASAKEALVKELAKTYGVEPALLGGFNDPDSMRAAATAYSAQAKEIASLKAGAIVKVPVQKFDGGAGTGAGPNRVKQDAYVAGKGDPMTAQEFKAVYGWDPL